MPGIKNFPMRNQLHDIVPPKDGKPDDNQDFHCVPESIAACIQSETGVRIAAEDLEDYAYGETHTGGGSALVYHQRGADTLYHVKIVYFEGDRPALIAEIKRNLDLGIPVLITMPSAWNTRNAANSNVDHPDFGTHCGVAYWYEGDNLSVMNPWGGWEQVKTFAQWEAELCFRSVWPVVKVTAMGLPNGWKDDGKQLSNPVNSFVVEGAKRQFILDNPWLDSDVPIADVENVADVEEANPALGAGNAQTFRMSRIIYTNADQRVRRQWLGPEYLTIRNDRDALKAQVAQLQAQLAQTVSLSDQDKADMALGQAFRAVVKEAA